MCKNLKVTKLERFVVFNFFVIVTGLKLLLIKGYRRSSDIFFVEIDLLIENAKAFIFTTLFISTHRTSKSFFSFDCCNFDYSDIKR